jgi:two-component system chemotaxis response regulator CheB
VITHDLVMPTRDGLGVLAALTPEQRSRVVVVSMADGETDIGVSALGFGIFDLVHKPTALAVASLHDISEELVSKVLLAGAQPRGRLRPRFDTRVVLAGPQSDKVVLIGTSTGGPHALTRLLKALPANFPAPIAIVLHIPVGYTGPLAERLNAECAIEVLEAYDGLAARAGLAILAQAGAHLRLVSEHGQLVARMDAEPSSAIHRPAVDVLFESAALCCGNRALGVVLTGMGDDGLLGARAIHAAGGEILTESEASCVVYGMPRCVTEAGLSTAAVALEQMAIAITSRL